MFEKAMFEEGRDNNRDNNVDNVDNNVIVNIAVEAGYPPYLMARIIVEALTGHKGKRLTDAMKDPSLHLSSPPHGSPFLASSVLKAVNSDPLCGPRHDLYRRHVGISFEHLLARQLDRLNVPFVTEDHLRSLGTSKTPDILLSSPVAFFADGRYRPVCWIDSKALFGDATTHRTEVVAQATGYVHRFGPGMLLYWFGHEPKEALWSGVPGAESGEMKDIVVVDRLPEGKVFPNGRGELRSAKGGGKEGLVISL